MSNYALEVLTKEHERLTRECRKLDHEFCTVPSYEQWTQGIEAMTVEEYERKEHELLEKIYSVEHAINTMRFLDSRNPNIVRT